MSQDQIVIRPILGASKEGVARVSDERLQNHWDGRVLSRYTSYLGLHPYDYPRCEWYWNAHAATLTRVGRHIHEDLNVPGREDSLLHGLRLDELERAGVLVRADVDEVAEIVRETREAVECAPLVFRVFTTTGCNASCPYCYERGIAVQYMDDTTADAVARYCIAAFKSRGSKNPVYIEWFGGEPLMNTDAISRICEALHDAHVPFRSFIFTNGMLIDKVPLTTLRELWNTDGLQVTFDGAAEEYEAAKGVPQGTFERVLSNVEHALKADLRVVLRINYDGDTGRTIRLVDILAVRFRNASIKARLRIDVVPLYGSDKEIPAETMHAVLDVYDYLISLEVADISQVYSLGPRRYGCFMASCGGHTIMPDGSLINCSHLAKAEQRVGDVFHPGQVDSARDAFIRRDFPSKCLECCLLPICRGGCRAAELGLWEGHQCHPYKNVLRRVLLKMTQFDECCNSDIIGS